MTRRKVSRKEVSFKRACKIVQGARGNKRRVAFISGCFEILHIGHIRLLELCKRGADILIVGVDDNETVSRAKGEEHPFFDETERMAVLGALEAVDYVFKFCGPCSAALLKELRPDFYCFSPFDPKYREKVRDAREAGARVKEAGDTLKSRSSSRIGRVIRFGYLLEKWATR